MAFEQKYTINTIDSSTTRTSGLQKVAGNMYGTAPVRIPSPDEEEEKRLNEIASRTMGTTSAGKEEKPEPAPEQDNAQDQDAYGDVSSMAPDQEWYEKFSSTVGKYLTDLSDEEKASIYMRSAMLSKEGVDPSEYVQEMLSATAIAHQTGLTRQEVLDNKQELMEYFAGTTGVEHLDFTTGYSIINAIKQGWYQQEMAGYKDEYRSLLASGYDEDSPAVQAVLDKIYGQTEKMAYYEDVTPHGWFINAVDNAVTQIPYMMSGQASGLMGNLLGGTLGLAIGGPAGLKIGKTLGGYAARFLTYAGQFGGESFWNMKEAGVSTETALKYSDMERFVNGLNEALLDVGFDLISGSLGLGTVFYPKFLKTLGLSGEPAKYGLKLLAYAGMEGGGEFIQEGSESLTSAAFLNFALAAEGLPMVQASKIGRDAFNEAVMGFTCGVLFGFGGGFVSTAIDHRTLTNLKDRVGSSREQFVNDPRNIRVAQEMQLNGESLTEQDAKDALGRFWDNIQQARLETVKAGAKADGKGKVASAVGDLVNKAKGQKQTNRNSEGRLRTEGYGYRKNADGSSAFSVAIGSSVDDAGNGMATRYGTVDVEVSPDGKTATIGKVSIEPGYESAAAEMVRTAIEDAVQGYEKVEMGDDSDIAKEIGSQLTSQNPNGASEGLNYRRGDQRAQEKAAFTDQLMALNGPSSGNVAIVRTRDQQADGSVKEGARLTGLISRDEANLIANVIDNLALAKGMTLNQYLDKFAGGSLLIDPTTQEGADRISRGMQDEPSARGFTATGLLGPDGLLTNVRGVIHVAATGDFTTFQHEVFHMNLRVDPEAREELAGTIKDVMETPERREDTRKYVESHFEPFKMNGFAKADEVLDALDQIKTGDDLVNSKLYRSEEALDSLYEAWLADDNKREASIPEALREMLRKIAQAMQRIYRTLKGQNVQIDEDIEKSFVKAMNFLGTMAEGTQQENTSSQTGTQTGEEIRKQEGEDPVVVRAVIDEKSGEMLETDVMEEKTAQTFVERLASDAQVMPQYAELTPEAWAEMFGEDRIVETPLGNLMVGENQFAKIMKNKRQNYWFLLKDTLQSPSFVLMGNPSYSDPSGRTFTFYKVFRTDGDESKWYMAVSAAILKNGQTIITNHRYDADDVVRDLKKFPIAYVASENRQAAFVQRYWKSVNSLTDSIDGSRENVNNPDESSREVSYQLAPDYEPQKVGHGYKMFEMDTRTGELYPLFLNKRYVMENGVERQAIADYPNNHTSLSADEIRANWERYIAKSDAREAEIIRRRGIPSQVSDIADEIRRQSGYSAEVQAQRQEVLDRYMGTDEWMKAPNGMDTRLTEDQWVTVRTRNFMRWSNNWNDVLKDSNGEPKLVYHGTGMPFESFDPNLAELGFHFTETFGVADMISRKNGVSRKIEFIKESLADGYYDDVPEELHYLADVGYRQTVLSAWVKMTSPLETDRDFSNWTLLDGDWDTFDSFVKWAVEKGVFTEEEADRLSPYDDLGTDIREALQEKGYDGIIYPNQVEGGGLSYIVFDNTQVKTTDNDGRFDPAGQMFRHQGVGLYVDNKTLDHFAEKILGGAKTIETRTIKSVMNIARAGVQVGDRIGIVYNGMVHGEVTLAGFIGYRNAEEFYADYRRHLVSEGSRYGFDDKKGKIGLLFSDPEIFDEPRPVRQRNDRTTVLYQGAYHGTSASFEAFNSSFVNTGTGSQTYGWGLYFTDSHLIAKDYAKSLANPSQVRDENIRWFKDRISRYARDLEEAREKLSRLEDTGSEEYRSLREEKSGEVRRGIAHYEKYPESRFSRRYADINTEERFSHAVDLLMNEEIAKARKEVVRQESNLEFAKEKLEYHENLPVSRRNLFRVELPDEGWLAWNGRTGDYPGLVDDVIAKVVEATGDDGEIARTFQGKDLPVHLLYTYIADAVGGRKEASQLLNGLGYVGFTYDAGQINALPEGVDKATNFVVFNESDVNVDMHWTYDTDEEAANYYQKGAGTVVYDDSISYEVKQNGDVVMTVRGSIDDAVAQLVPETKRNLIKGRRKGDTITFTGSAATIVRNSLEGRGATVSSAKVNRGYKYDNDGAIVGAPSDANTADKARRRRAKVLGFAMEGEDARFWYERSSLAFYALAGGDRDMADKIVGLSAIFSPGTGVDPNTGFMIDALNSYRKGEPIRAGRFPAAMGAKADALMYENKGWEGIKTNNFNVNLLSGYRPELEQGVTVDMWMMRVFGYGNDAPTTAQFEFVRNEVAKIAEELGWRPHQAQAAIWTSIKARWESDAVTRKFNDHLRSLGFLDEKGKLTKAGAEYNDSPEGHLYRIRLAYNVSWDEVKAELDSSIDWERDYSDFLARHTVQVSLEAAPSVSSGILKGYEDAPQDVKEKFLHDSMALLRNDRGLNGLADIFGLRQIMDVEGPGVWEGVVSPGLQELYYVKTEKVKKNGETYRTIAKEDKRRLDAYAAAMGLLWGQDGVGWNKSFATTEATRSLENALALTIGEGRVLTPEEMILLEASVREAGADMGIDAADIGFVSIPTGVQIVNYSFGGISNEDFFEISEKGTGKFFEKLGGERYNDYVKTKRYRHESGFAGNDWKEHPNGQAYSSWFREAGRSDVLYAGLLRYAEDYSHLRERYAEEYGWKNEEARLPVLQDEIGEFVYGSEWPQEKERIEREGLRLQGGEDISAGIISLIEDYIDEVAGWTDGTSDVVGSLERDVLRLSRHVALDDFDTDRSKATMKGKVSADVIALVEDLAAPGSGMEYSFDPPYEAEVPEARFQGGVEELPVNASDLNVPVMTGSETAKDRLLFNAVADDDVLASILSRKPQALNSYPELAAVTGGSYTPVQLDQARLAIQESPRTWRQSIAEAFGREDMMPGQTELPQIDFGSRGDVELFRDFSSNMRTNLANSITGDGRLQNAVRYGSDGLDGMTEDRIRTNEEQLERLQKLVEDTEKDLQEKTEFAQRLYDEVQEALRMQNEDLANENESLQEDKAELQTSLKRTQTSRDKWKKAAHDKQIELNKANREKASIQKTLDKYREKVKDTADEQRKLRKIREYKMSLAKSLTRKWTSSVDFRTVAPVMQEIRNRLDPKFVQAWVYDPILNPNGDKGGATMAMDDARKLVEGLENGTMTEQQVGATRQELRQRLGAKVYDRLSGQSAKPLNDWTIAELEELNEKLDEAWEEGRAIQKARDQARKLRRKNMVNGIVDTIMQTKEYQRNAGYVASGSLEDAKARSRGRFFRSFRYSTMRMQELAAKMDGVHGVDNRSLLVDAVREAQEQEVREVERRTSPIHSVISAVNDRLGKMAVEEFMYQEKFSFDYGTGETSFSGSALAYVYLAQFNERAKEAVAYGNLVDQQEKGDHDANGNLVQYARTIVDDADLKRIGMERFEALLKFAEKTLNDRGMMPVVLAIQSDLESKDNSKALLDFSLDTWNQPIALEDHYLPIRRTAVTGDEIKSPQDVNLVSGNYLSKVKDGFLEEKKTFNPRHQKPCSLDLLGVWTSSVEQQEHLKATGVLLSDINYVYERSSMVRDTIARAYGNEMLAEIEDYTHYVADPSYTDVRNDVSKVMRFFQGSTAAGYLSFKVSSLVTQLVSSPAPFVGEARLGDLLKGYALMMVKPMQMWEFVTSRSTMMANRSADLMIQAIKDSMGDPNNGRFQRFMAKAEGVGMAPLEWVDKFCVAGGWLGVYNTRLDENLAKGMSSAEAEKAAVKAADEVVYRTQPTGTKTENARLFRSGNAAVRLILQFQSAMNVVWNNVTSDASMDFRRAREGDGKALARLVGHTVGYAMAGIILGAIQDGFKPDDDDSELKAKARKIGTVVSWAASQGVESMPIVGSAVSDAMAGLLSGQVSYNTSFEIFPTAAAVLEGFGRLGNVVWADDAEKRMNALKSSAKSLLKGGSLMFGLPYSGMKQIYRSVEEKSVMPALGRY